MLSPCEDQTEQVIEINNLERCFGAKKALDAVTLSVPREYVFGIVGINGAGKTTLLKHVLGLLRPQTGSVSVLGRDPIADPVIRTISEEGRTVVFSSHLLDEVERVADHIAMLHQGKVLYCGTLDEMKRSFRRVTLRFQAPQETPPRLESAFDWRGGGYEWTAMCHEGGEKLYVEATITGAEIVAESSPTLDEIFVAHAASNETVPPNCEA